LPSIRVARCMPWLRRSRRARGPVAYEHDLADDAPLLEQLVRASRVGKRKALRDQRLDLLPLQEAEQGDQILPEQSPLQPLERLDGVGDDPLPAGEEPAAHDVQRVNGDSVEAMTTAWTGRTQSCATERGGIAITHHPPAGTESLAGMPEVRAPDG